MRVIAEHIKGHKAQAGERKSYYIYFVPRRRMMCERVLEEEGVWGQGTSQFKSFFSPD